MQGLNQQSQQQGQNYYSGDGINVDTSQQQYDWSAYYNQPQQQQQQQAPPVQQRITKWNCVWHSLQHRPYILLRADPTIVRTVRLWSRWQFLDIQSTML